jgi:hypothetical protein
VNQQSISAQQKKSYKEVISIPRWVGKGLRLHLALIALPRPWGS